MISIILFVPDFPVQYLFPMIAIIMIAEKGNQPSHFDSSLCLDPRIRVSACLPLP